MKPMRWMVLAALTTVSACADYEPHVKQAVYDPGQQELVMPYPCPDWSHSAQLNHDNSLHSNFGCATATNMALQLEDPKDLLRGHGSSGPDAEVNARVIELYRAGTIPVVLTPQQASGVGE